MTREDIFQYVADSYGTEPEYLWLSTPNYAVLRHAVGGKWYAAVMDLTYRMLGLPGDDPVDVLNLKLDPALILILREQPGYLPAYHMNKTHWITLLLDGTIPEERVKELIEVSYDLTRPKMKANKKEQSS